MEANVKQFPPRRSEKLDLFLPAFCKLQSQYKSVNPNRFKPHFKNDYADLDAILAPIREIMAENGFSISFDEDEYNGNRYLITTLFHSSEQFKTSIAKIIQDKPGIQGYGTALTYHARYSCKNLLGITITSDPYDDDGESTLAKEAEAKASLKKKENSHDNTIGYKKEVCLSRGEIIAISNELRGFDEIRDALREYLTKNNIKTLKECPARYAGTIKTFINLYKDKTKDS